MPNSQPTLTKTKTTTELGVALAFLAVSSLLAWGISRSSPQPRTASQLIGQRAAQATPTFCLTETSFLPENQGNRSVAGALLGTQPVHASSHTTSQNVEVRTLDGSLCPAVIEIRDRGEVVDTVSLASGSGTITSTAFTHLFARCTSGTYRDFTGWGGIMLNGTRVIVVGNDPTISDGTVTVELVDELGRRMPSRYIEVKRGEQVVAYFRALSGEEHIGLDPGIYEVTATSIDNRWRGTGTVESRQGGTTRYVIRLTTRITPTATAEVPREEPLVAQLPGQQDCGSGTVRVIAGNICDRDNRILTEASGIINVLQGGQGVCQTNAVGGAFAIYDRPNGTYTIRFQNPGLGVFEKAVTLEPKRVNFRMR